MNDEKLWMVYILKCSDGSLYCGATKNLVERIKRHNEGKGAKYTRSRKPLILVAASPFKMTQSNALKVESKVKNQKKENKIDFLKNFKESDLNK